MELLEGQDLKGDEEKEMKQEGGQQEGEEEGITEGEVRYQIKKLKKGKAAGDDGLHNEVWLFGDGKIVSGITKLINKVWKGERLPESWREGIISPIFKKGDRSKEKNYRGITLLNTAYKIYAMVLENRLSRELERKEIIPETQAGFRRGRSTIDNIIVLNNVANREIKDKGGKLYAFFADLTAAFDKVSRRKLSKIMEEKGISKNLRERIEEIYTETRNKIRVNGKISEKFWMTRGLRQGCPLSPTLFSLYIGNLEEKLRRGQAGGVVVGRVKL